MGEKPILEFMMPKNSRKTVKFSCEQEDGGEGERKVLKWPKSG